MGQLLSQGPLFIVCLIFMMGIVVVVHEYGHYLVGRWFGAAVESFSIGFGRSVFERTDKNGTRWRVNWIPLGGFVKFVGEAQTAADIGVVEKGPVGKAYKDLSPLKRIAVSLAGPVANFILAIAIFALVFGVHGRAEYRTIVVDTQEGLPAEAAGFQAGDIIVSINGKEVANAEAISIAIMLNPNTPLDFEVDREGGAVTLTVVPEEIVRENNFGQETAQSTIGVRMGRVEGIERIRYNPVEAVGQGAIETWAAISRTVTMLDRIATGKMSIHTMSGPVSIGDISRRAVNQVWAQEEASRGEKIMQMFWMLVSICAAISVGVGFFNLLPLPVLDGGHIVFNIFELITGRELPEKVQEASLTFGVILLLGMVVVITWGDILETGVLKAVGG
ncbi:MAG: M50 family metallopeptidase [Hyphomonas sp.]